MDLTAERGCSAVAYKYWKARGATTADRRTPLNLMRRRPDFAAAVIVAALAVTIAWGLMRFFSAARYDGEIHINIYGLGLLTVAAAVPGAIAMAAAVFNLVIARRFLNWPLAGCAGSGLAVAGAIALSAAADCIPHCNGSRGDVLTGVAFAIPAGFGVGALTYGTWRAVRSLLTSTGEGPP